MFHCGLSINSHIDNMILKFCKKETHHINYIQTMKNYRTLVWSLLRYDSIIWSSSCNIFILTALKECRINLLDASGWIWTFLMGMWNTRGGPECRNQLSNFPLKRKKIICKWELLKWMNFQKKILKLIYAGFMCHLSLNQSLTATALSTHFCIRTRCLVCGIGRLESRRENLFISFTYNTKWANPLWRNI